MGGHFSFNRGGTLWRVAPFAGTTGVALLTLPVTSVHFESRALVAALALMVAFIVCGAVVARFGLPRWTSTLLLLLLFALVVALLRHAAGGGDSGFSSLALLPLVWLALYGTRRELVASLAFMAATLIGPIVAVGGTSYPPSEWRRAALMLMIGGMVGMVIQGLVDKIQSRADDLEAQTRALEIVARTMRELPSDSEVRGRICEAALAIGEAHFCVLLEPDGAGNLVSSGQAGLAVPTIVISIDSEISGASKVFKSGLRRFASDVRADMSVSRRLVEATGAVSVLYEPVMRAEECVGVLGVIWCKRVDIMRQSAIQGVGMLAAEAAVAIERGDLVHRITELSRSDSLTGLANRRTWDEALAQEKDRALRSATPMSIALIDLDHFKAYNDRYGHQAGDLLLKEASAVWVSQLRDVDLIARWGGEEFSLLLPMCPLDQAKLVLERLQLAMPGGVTFSAGVAQWDYVESVTDLMKRADGALYSAKEQGRARVLPALAGG